jgi:hypothetical protein
VKNLGVFNGNLILSPLNWTLFCINSLLPIQDGQNEWRVHVYTRNVRNVYKILGKNKEVGANTLKK